MHSVSLIRLLLGHPHLVLVHKSVAPGQSHGVFGFTRRLAKRLATYASSPIKPKGRSDEELAGATGVRISPLAGYGPLNRSCCCYCGGGLGSGLRRRPHNRKESRERRRGKRHICVWLLHARPRRDVCRAHKVARAVTAPRAQ
jgi:hypothetical protein